jgi:hypothetical protein
MMLVPADSVNVTTYFHLRLAADGTDATGLTITGIDLQYVRSGVAPAAKVDATALAATDSAHGDNQAIEIDATDQPGVYRVDWPDAAFAAGVPEVILTVKVATAFTESLRVKIGPVDANLMQILGSAITGTASQIVAAFTKWFNVTSPTGTVNSLPDAVPGAAGGAFIAGTNAATTVTTALTTTFTGNLTGSVASVTAGVTLAAAAVQAIWDALTSALTTAGSIGKLLVDNINATISSRSSQTSVDDLPTNAELASSQAAADDATLAAIAALNNLSAAQVNAEVDTALADIHLDHLLAATYDPASKPGATDALLNELIESDAGVSRFTANALEQAPTGGSAPTVGEIADAVWDEATAGHTTSGTFGEQVKTDVDAILADTNELQTDWVNGGRLDLLIDAILADTAELQTDWVNGGRLDLILDARASQTSVDDLPTNAELATALGTADDAVLAAIAALNNLSQANIRTAVGLTAANLDTQLGDLPTNAELATALASADDAVLAAIAALNNLSAAQVNAEVVDALATDTYGEPTGVPAATVSLAAKLGLLHMTLRNGLTVTATAKTFLDDGGAAEWKKTLADDGSVYAEGEAEAP